MKIIETMKNNYKVAKDKELAAKREKAAQAAKKDLKEIRKAHREAKKK